MMVPRKNIPPKILKEETRQIGHFFFECVAPCEGNKLSIHHIFESYKKWRETEGLPKTAVSVDGFGRLFPRSYRRGSTYFPELKKVLKCVFDMELTC